MVGYGLVFFACYLLLIAVQHLIFTKQGKWTLGYEIVLVVLFYLYSLPACYAYYKTDRVNGEFSLSTFTTSVYLPTLAILTPVILFGRYWAGQPFRNVDKEVTSPEQIVLTGTNKLDILQLQLSDLVALEGANNYVAVHFLRDGQLDKKLLRSSLKKMHEAVPQLTQVHRSYLVNLQHFVKWEDGLTLSLTQLSVPVSQKYKPALLAMPAFAPN